MKKQSFFPAFTLFLALFLFASCERDSQPEPAESGGATTTAVTPGDPEASVGFRTCGAVSTECIIAVDVTTGAANYTVCGQVYGPDDFCDEPVPNCANAKGRRQTYTMDDSFCVDYVYHPVFFIFNDNTTGSITVDVTSSGGDALGINIPANSFVGFEVNANCDITECP